MSRSRNKILPPLVTCPAPGCTIVYRPSLERRGACSHFCVEALRQAQGLAAGDPGSLKHPTWIHYPSPKTKRTA